MRRFRSLAPAVAITLFLMVPALGGGRPLAATLEAGNEVPPVQSNASGIAHITLNQGLGEVCVDIESSGFEGQVIAGHIHRGPEGVGGPVVIGLGVNSPNFSNCVEADGDLIKEIRQDPSAFYVNVHSTAFPGGEIRGQLTK